MRHRILPGTLLLLAGACGGGTPPIAGGGDGAGGEDVALASSTRDPSAHCARAAEEDEGEVRRCTVVPGEHRLASGVVVWQLELEEMTDQGVTRRAGLVFEGDTPEVEWIVDSSPEIDGEAGDYRIGRITVDGDTLTVEVTSIDLLRGCTGDPSCFDDDDNIERTEHPCRVVCSPREVLEDEAGMTPEQYEADRGEPHPGVFECVRHVDEVSPAEKPN